jgi:hypothetical protein
LKAPRSLRSFDAAFCSLDEKVIRGFVKKWDLEDTIPDDPLRSGLEFTGSGRR